ncbi:MAG: MlaD family protein [Pseudomonadota bacterium]
MLPEPQPAPLIPHVEFKAAVLLALTFVLICGFLAYVMYARGVFESTRRLVLVAEDSEGAKVGMDLTFSGFPIGRVKRIELAEDGKARILIDVPSDDARWLRTSTVFTMERGLVGDTRIRAFTGVLNDPPLPDAAMRPVLRGDASAEIPRLIATTRVLLENLERMSGTDSSLNASLANVQTVTERMKGRYGALAGVLGGEDNARKVISALDRANALLASLGEVSSRFERTLAKTDERVFGAAGVMDETHQAIAQLSAVLLDARERVFGSAGVMDETQKAIAQLSAVLLDARESLKKVDAVLAEAQAVGANTRAATTDLNALRAEVEASLRKIAHLVDEINRKWPFARDTQLKLP